MIVVDSIESYVLYSDSNLIDPLESTAYNLMAVEHVLALKFKSLGGVFVFCLVFNGVSFIYLDLVVDGGS